jgi:hypothetical protein
VGVTIESYGKLEISYINVDNFPEICRGQVHGARKERRIKVRIRIIIIIIRNGAKTISLQTLFGRLIEISYINVDNF